MKYGQALQERSLPQWAAYNVDYNELKHMIKANTSRDQGQAIAIPGHVDSALSKFEDQFFVELSNQHDRVDLFVRSKIDELNRRLREYQKRSINLIARSTGQNGQAITVRRLEKFSRMEYKVIDCNEEIRNLDRFVEAQRIAFVKILKKYKKWTGSSSLGHRFNEAIIASTRSFVHYDFSDLKNQCANLLSLLRSASPVDSASTTPTDGSRRTSSSIDARRQRRKPQEPPLQVQQAYWNEYDNGSELGDNDNEPYTIYYSPDSRDSFPGTEAVAYIIRKVKIPFEHTRKWFTPKSSPGEQRPLLAASNGNGNSNGLGTDPRRQTGGLAGTGYFDSRVGSATDLTETEIDDASSNEFPSGYEAHYATFPSIPEQKLPALRETILFRTTMASFLASFVLLLVAGILIATGRHRLRVEVDAGVTVGVVASLFFATLGLSVMVLRWARCGWVQRACVLCLFTAAVAVNGFLLVLVMGNTAT